MKVLKVALTGGPCGGKTTSIQKIESEFTEKGYHVIVVPEAATILINSGIRPFGNCAVDMVDFQRKVNQLQLTLENIAEKTASSSDKKVIIVCDRGIIDNKAYISKEQFKKVISESSLTEMEVMARYDLVIHLTSAAVGKEEFYTLDNNGARTETVEEARKKDKKTLEGWLGHENLKIIGNDTDFENKINTVIEEIYSNLKVPAPIQIQKKYLVSNIDLEKLEDIKLVKLEIEQYIEENNNKDIMYRKTTKDGESKYTVITKIDTDINNERITTRRCIGEKEYYDNIPKEKRPITKTRYCFAYKNQYFRLDIFSDELKILEIEQTNKSREVSIPKFIQTEEDITDNINYRNSSLFSRLNNNKNEKILKK